jgi:hypothetical protein
MEGQVELNLIRIGTGTRINGVLRYANVLLKERNFREIHFRGLGASVGKLVTVVELLKLTHPGMYQINKIGTVAFQLKEGNESIINERLYPKLEIVLSLDPPKEKTVGYQDKMAEEERSRLCGIMERTGFGGPGIFRGLGRGRARGLGRGRGSFTGRNRSFRGRGAFGGQRSRSGSFNSFGGGFRGRGAFSPRGRGFGRGRVFGRGRGGFRGRGFGGTPRGMRARGGLF